MSPQRHNLSDDHERQAAIANHKRSFLVEAGAGSGKTAVMAGRIAMLLADGVAPKSIAAVTFTEFAASELLIRVRDFVEALKSNNIPTELCVALPENGLSKKQHRNLEAAAASLDEMTCSTIHGFCQRLITPYPVEANIDPGASVMDRDLADLAFAEITDSWLREELAEEADSLLAALVLHDPEKTIALVRTVLDHLRLHRAIAPYERHDLAKLGEAFQKAVEKFNRFLEEADVEEPETADIATHFRVLTEEIQAGLAADTPTALVRLLNTTPHHKLLTKKGTFFAYQKKGKWETALEAAGLRGKPAKVEAERLFNAARDHYAQCESTWNAFPPAVATHVLADLVLLVKPVMECFQRYKRNAALLDFNDLIFAARNLLRDHDEVRRVLSKRFKYVLVDEFQDTDPLQIEIFWRLCGDPPAGINSEDWSEFTLRPGALFLVGDPKQAIYRFRGADIAAYGRARKAFCAQESEGVLSIATNFRSCAPIMEYVNARFKVPLSKENNQPGFQALVPNLGAREDGPSVVALDIKVPADEKGKHPASQQRNSEAVAIADMCARLIGNERILDSENGGQRLCRAGDIALLAPTNTDLWRYEAALEQRGIPVASQAGKRLYQRQEVQDLIAVTRVLADQRDTLALGALLRGPVVGLTEEELLDIVWTLPRDENAPDALPRLNLGVAPETIKNAHARDIVEKLQALRRQINTITPHALLSQAIDVLRLRPILLNRHGRQAERALANVDLYLNFSRAYAVRGLRAFAEAMTAAWNDNDRAVESQPDAQEEAVALYTMHAAKGLEWPIVVPINMMTKWMPNDSAVFDRETGKFYCTVFEVKPTRYEAAKKNESEERCRERVRLWYVAATRAKELLILPRLDVTAGSSTWLTVVDLALDSLTALDLEHLAPKVGGDESTSENMQTREVFEAEAVAIAERIHHIEWRAPSREESSTQLVLPEGVPAIITWDGDGTTVDDASAATIQGGRERGTILHKLIEEVLTGEVSEEMTALTARAQTLIHTLGMFETDNPGQGIAPSELAGCVLRALALPEVDALRPGLVPEFPVYASTATNSHEQATAGIADAVFFDASGAPKVVIDWKSDVDPSPESLEKYCNQVRDYLNITGAERGMVIYVTSGTVHSVVPAK